MWEVECGRWSVGGGVREVECGRWSVGGGMWLCSMAYEIVRWPFASDIRRRYS